MTRCRDVAGARLAGTDSAVIVSDGVRGRPSVRVTESGKTTGRCEIRSRTGEFDAVAVAPDASVAAVRWADQTEAGLVLVELAAELRQRARWETRDTNWLEGPVWTPGSGAPGAGREPAGARPLVGSARAERRGRRRPLAWRSLSPGSVIGLDRELHERFRRRVELELPLGWFPSSDPDRGLAAPIVIGPDEVSVRVPVEGDRLLRLRDV